MYSKDKLHFLIDLTCFYVYSNFLWNFTTFSRHHVKSNFVRQMDEYLRQVSGKGRTKTFTENWDSKRHLLEHSWSI